MVDTKSQQTYFWDFAVPCGYHRNNSQNVVQRNPNEDKYYFLTPYLALPECQLYRNFHLKALVQ